MDPTAIVRKGAEYGATIAFNKLKDWIRLVSDYNQNLQNVKDFHGDLEEKLKETQEIVEVGERNNQVVIHDVKKWEQNVESFLCSTDEDANKEWKELFIDEEVRKKADSCCFRFVGWNPKYRHHISRVAKEKIDAIQELNKKISEFGSNLTRPSLQTGLQSNEGDYFEGLKSREKKLEEIMVALQDDNINRIGIYGMGGVGKTTLVEEIAGRTKNTNMFNEVILVEISEDPNIKLIQDRIASKIGFHAIDNIHAVEQRAMGLYQILKRLKAKDSKGSDGIGKGGKLLVILDNLWDKLQLHLIGIYSELEKDMECKIIVTSRSLEVCRMMDVSTCMFHIGDLDHEEAKQLFKKKVGSEIFEREEYKDLTTRVLELCPCLPLSTSLLANTLKNQPPYVWKDAIKELENPITGNVGGRVLHGTYSIVKMSYKYIMDEDQKRFFLLCCLFPPSSSIYIKDLLRYGIGLGLFQYVRSLEEALSQARNWIDKLKSLSLILDVNMSTGEIKIHDDVREAGKFFEDQGEFSFHVGDIPRWLEIETQRQYAAISTTTSNSNYRRLSGLDLPNLQLLRILGSGSSIMCDDYFSGMQNIKVLDLSNMEFKAFPISIEHLSNLRTLLIENCSVEDISQLGKLTKLQVLSMRSCHALMKLPQEIGNLVDLKLLDINDCKMLHEIPAHTLERLTQLEGLYMMKSFTNWQVEGSMASIHELNSLALLQVLEVTIRCVEHLPHGDFPTPSITSYKIVFGSESSMLELEKDLSFSLDLQVRQVDSYHLMKEGWKTLLEKSERLHLECIHNFEKITHSTIFLFNLQVLHLVRIMGTEYALPAQSAGKLKVLKVSDCKKLKYIFYTFGALQGENASIDDDGEVQFPCLQEIELDTLPSLESFCFTKSDEITTDDEASKNIKTVFCRKEQFDNDEEIQFPCSKEIELDTLSPEETFCFTQSDKIIIGDAVSKNHKTLFRRKTIFLSLKKLNLSSLDMIEELWDTRAGDEFSNVFADLENINVSSMPKLKHVWGKQMVDLQWLNLKKLEMDNCHCIESVCEIKNYTSRELLTLTCFPQLRYLKLHNLDGLTCFFRGKVNIKFPALNRLDMHNLKSFTTFGKPALDDTQDTKDEDEDDDDGDGDGDDDDSMSGMEYFNGGGIQTNALFYEGKVLLPSLEKLFLGTLDQIETVWTTKYISEEEGCIMRFPKLQYLDFAEMAKLRVIWQWSGASTHEIGCIEAPLTYLWLQSLPMLAGIVEVQTYVCHENYDEVDTNTEASTEETSHLLANDTKSVLFNCNVILSSSVINVRLENLDKIETIWAINVFNEKVDFATGFPQLNVLDIVHLPKLKAIWKGAKSGSCIKFPLKSLWLEDLSAFEGLAKVERSESDNEETCNVGALIDVKQVFLPSLVKLRVGKLQNIDRIWDVAVFQEVRFPKLEILYIFGMPKLRHVWIGAICNLESLTNILIENCEVMESLVHLPRPTENSDGSKDTKFHQEEIIVINFPALNGLFLENLPLIQVLFKRVDGNIIDATSGEEVDRGTEELKMTKTTFLSGKFHIPSLKNLTVENMAQLEGIYDDSTTDTCPGNLFPKLDKLSLGNCPMFKGRHLSESFLGNLSIIFVRRFKRLRCLFSSSSNNSSVDEGLFTIAALTNLQELTVSNCPSLEELFEVGSDGATTLSTPLMLKHLTLHMLAKLKHVPFFMLPDLQSIKMRSCFRQRNTCVWFLASVDSMLRGPMFQKLEKLQITNCHGIEAIIGEESTGDQLVDSNLEQPKARRVAEIVKFPSLKTVEIRGCASLYAFSLANYSVIMPSLESVVISQSMSIKRFTSRNLVAPRLSNVVIDEDTIEVQEDFNTILLRQMKENCKVIKKWPKTLKHMLHREHELKLTSRFKYWCDKCSEALSGYAYSCTPCNFDLHPTCALNENQLTDQPLELKVAEDWPRTLQHELHTDHPLHLVMGKLYACDACEQKGFELFSFSCIDCDFDLHPKCALDEKLLPDELDEEDDEETDIMKLSPHVESWSANLVSPSATDPSTSRVPGVPFSKEGKSVELQSSEIHGITNQEMQEVMSHVPSTIKELEVVVSAVKEALPTALNLPGVSLQAPNISAKVTQEDPISSLVVPLLQQLLTSINSTNTLLLSSINSTNASINSTNALLVEMNKKLDATLSDKEPSNRSD